MGVFASCSVATVCEIFSSMGLSTVWSASPMQIGSMTMTGFVDWSSIFTEYEYCRLPESILHFNSGETVPKL